MHWLSVNATSYNVEAGLIYFYVTLYDFAVICLTNKIHIMIISNEYKKNKYGNISLCGSSVAVNRKITPHFIEASTLGFISNCLDFTKAVKFTPMPDTVTGKVQDCRFCSKIFFRYLLQ